MQRDYGRPRRRYQDHGERWTRDDYAGGGRPYEYDRLPDRGPSRWRRDYDDRARRDRGYDRERRVRDHDWGRTRWTGVTGQFDRDFEGRPWDGWYGDNYGYDYYGRASEPNYGRYPTPDQSWRPHPGDYGRFDTFDEPRHDWNPGAERDYGRSYAGRGPRGYQRRDERILEDVCDRLCDDARVDASEIDVRVADGEVILSGTVEDRWQKRLAERVAESVWGVRDVHNQLRIARAPSGDTSSGMARGGNGRPRVHVGMHVLGADGDHLGRVKEVGTDCFLLDRPLARDLYVPLAAVQHVAGDQAVLRVPSDRVDDQGWPHPDVIGDVAAPIANAADTVRPRP